MIKFLHMTNWKSFANAKLFLDPVTILLGANGSGKSNALDALMFLHRIATGINLTEALTGNSHLAGLRGSLEWATMTGATHFGLSLLVEGEEDHTEFFYSITATIHERKCIILDESLKIFTYHSRQRDAPPDELKLFWTEPNPQSRSTITTRLYHKEDDITCQTLRSHAILSQLRHQPMRQEIMAGIEKVLTLLQDIFIFDPIPDHMRHISPLADTLNPDAANIAGVMAALGDEQKQAMDQAVERYMRHLPEQEIRRIWAEPVGRLQTDAILYCEEQWPTRPETIDTVDVRGMSDGTLRFLAILTALITRPAGTLLVIEEVDQGLHPSRSDLLIQMVKEIGKQRNLDVLVTTHHPSLLDASGPEMIPYITIAHRDLATGHSRLTLLEDVAHLPKLLAMGSVGRLFSSGRLERVLAREERALP